MGCCTSKRRVSIPDQPVDSGITPERAEVQYTEEVIEGTIEGLTRDISNSKEVDDDTERSREELSKETVEETNEEINEEVNEEVNEEINEEVNEEEIMIDENSIPNYPLDPEGRVRGKKGSIASMEDSVLSMDAALVNINKLKQRERRDSTQSNPEKSLTQHYVTVKFKDIESSLKTGDLALLYRHNETQPNFGIFVNNSVCDTHFPLLMIKGKTKPLPLELFDPTHRDVRVITAVTRIFYGDYEKVAIRRLRAGPKEIECSEVLEIAENVENIPFTPQEIMFISEADTPIQRSLYTCTFTLSHVYKQLGIMLVNPIDVRPDTFQDALPLGESVYIKLPPSRAGPLIDGTPPLLSKLIDGIRPAPDYAKVSYSEIRESLQTGDIILFSGATSSGAIIKIFDGAIFSHVGLVIRPRYTSYVMIWESSTNKAGLVDIDTGSVRKGVALIPLRKKIFSGWYNRVAIRKLTGLSDEQRAKLYENMLKIRRNLQGRPYEKNHLELIMSAVNVNDTYLEFLRTHHEDLSSLFCSELVAHAYQELGLIDKTKLSNEYSPDDFASHRQLKLKFGQLESEVYIDLKFDYQTSQIERHTSISAREANEIN